MTLFIVLSLILTLVAVAIPVVPLLRNSEGGASPLSAVTLALAIPAGVVLMYLTVSNYDWQDTPADNTQAAAAPDMQAAIAGLEAKLNDNPDDIDSWLLLGNAYIQVQDFDAARTTFMRVLERVDDRRAKLGLAEATVLQDRSTLTGPVAQVFEDVLVDEPLNAKALFYAGMAALAREDNELVRKRWGRLLDLSPPDNVRRILEQQIAMLEPGAAESGDTSAIAIGIDVAPAISAQINPGDSLFVVARVPDQPGPPIAALRLTVQTFPIKAELSDANVMLPGRSLNDANTLEIIARVSKSGDAIAKPGDVFGDVIFERQGNAEGNVDVLLDRVVEGS